MGRLVLCGGLVGSLMMAVPSWAQGPVYRCPGPPVLYTDNLSATEAQAKGCRTIEGAPVTVVTVPKPRANAGAPGAAAGAAPGAGGASAAARGSDTRVDPAAQRARDSDARRILSEELQREEERLAQLRKDYSNGQPERRGEERNYQKYIDRVAEMKAAVMRKEADVAAIKRELAKLPP